MDKLYPKLPPEDSPELVLHILKTVDLEAFFPKLRDELHVTRLAHFDFVKPNDLARIKMSRPASRRLLAAVKLHQDAMKPPGRLTGIIDKVLPKSKASPSPKPSVPSKSPAFYPNIPHLNPAVAGCLIDAKDIVIKEKLGQGTFGEVMRAEWTKPDGQVVATAVKMLRDEAALAGAFSDFVTEVDAMIGLHHPHLISLYGISLSSPYMIVQELAPLGSVLDRLRKECGKTSVVLIFSWAKQICQGMEFLESKRKVHRDLAARNVLLASIDRVKIGDFGLTKSIHPDEDCYTMTEHKKIPFPWCAPESIKWKKFSHASDCWAYGVTLWELFTFGRHPWTGCSGAKILELIDPEGQRLAKPDACPTEIYQIMYSCWLHRPQDRPTFASLAQYLNGKTLDMLKAAKPCNEEGKLKLQEGDDIVVIDGRLDHYWWTGQNQRTYEIGQFPRVHATSGRRKKQSDISNPLRHSFVHTGHGDVDPSKTFGSPAVIDDIFLRNPVPAVDLLGELDSPSALTTPIDLKQYTLSKPPENKKTSRGTSSVPSSSPPRDVLIDLSDDARVVHPVLNRYNSQSDSNLASFDHDGYQGSSFYSNDLDHIASVPGYFNVPPTGNMPSPSSIYPTAPPYYSFSDLNPASKSNTLSTVTTPGLPKRPEIYSNVLQSPNTGMLSGNGTVFPTVTTQYSPHDYYNTRTVVTRPAHPPPVSSVQSRPTANSNGVPPHIAALLLPPTKSSNPAKDHFKNEHIIKTTPILDLDDPFDTTLVERSLKTTPVQKVFPVVNKPTEAQKSMHKSAETEAPVYATVNKKEVARVTPYNVTPGRNPGSVLEDLVRKVQSSVPGESEKNVQNILQKCHFDAEKAVAELKLERLVRLDVAPEAMCRKVLENCEWDVERAGEALLSGT